MTMVHMNVMVIWSFMLVFMLSAQHACGQRVFASDFASSTSVRPLPSSFPSVARPLSSFPTVSPSTTTKVPLTTPGLFSTTTTTTTPTTTTTTTTPTTTTQTTTTQTTTTTSTTTTTKPKTPTLSTLFTRFVTGRPPLPTSTSSSLLSNQTTESDVTSGVTDAFPTAGSTQWVVITCAENYNETVRRNVSGNVTDDSDRYAKSLLPDIADVSGVVESQVSNVSALENPVNGNLVIKFGLEDRRALRAVQAVVNLRRGLGLLSVSTRHRRLADTASRLLRSTIDNQTVTPTAVYNWTDDGLCLTQSCGKGGYCSWHLDPPDHRFYWQPDEPDFNFYCACLSGQIPTSDGDDRCGPVPVPTERTSTDCLSRTDCIVLIVVVTIVGFLVIVLFVVFVVCTVRRRRQKHRNERLKMIFSRSDSTNPVLDMQTIETRSVTASDQASSMPPRPPPPSVIDPNAKKQRKWTRLRFKRTRRHLDPVATDENGYPSAIRSADMDTGSIGSDNSGLPIDKSKTIAEDYILSY